MPGKLSDELLERFQVVGEGCDGRASLPMKVARLAVEHIVPEVPQALQRLSLVESDNCQRPQKGLHIPQHRETLPLSVNLLKPS